MKKLIFIGAIGLLLFSCKSKKDAANTMEEMDESKTSSLFEEMEEAAINNTISGTYSGLIPCADCMGIQVEITFKDDNTYIKKSRYLGKSKKTFVENGSYTFDEYEEQVVCQNADGATTNYSVEGKTLIINQEENKALSSVQELYTLYKNNGRLSNRLWTATELLKTNVDSNKVTFILRNDSTVSASGGCNQINGAVKLNEEKQQLAFGRLAMTKMACQHKHYDKELAEALNSCFYFSIDKKGLLNLLSKEKDTVGVFVGSKLK